MYLSFAVTSGNEQPPILQGAILINPTTTKKRVSTFQHATIHIIHSPQTEFEAATVDAYLVPGNFESYHNLDFKSNLFLKSKSQRVSNFAKNRKQK